RRGGLGRGGGRRGGRGCEREGGDGVKEIAAQDGGLGEGLGVGDELANLLQVAAGLLGDALDLAVELVIEDPKSGRADLRGAERCCCSIGKRARARWSMAGCCSSREELMRCSTNAATRTMAASTSAARLAYFRRQSGICMTFTARTACLASAFSFNSCRRSA